MKIMSKHILLIYFIFVLIKMPFNILHNVQYIYLLVIRFRSSQWNKNKDSVCKLLHVYFCKQTNISTSIVGLMNVLVLLTFPMIPHSKFFPMLCSSFSGLVLPRRLKWFIFNFKLTEKLYKMLKNVTL